MEKGKREKIYKKMIVNTMDVILYFILKFMEIKTGYSSIPAN